MKRRNPSSSPPSSAPPLEDRQESGSTLSKSQPRMLPASSSNASSSSLPTTSTPLSVSPNAKRFKVLDRQGSELGVKDVNGSLPSRPDAVNGSGNINGNAQWEKVEKKKKGKKGAALNKDVSGPPRFYYSTAELKKRHEPIGISDVRDLILHLLGLASPQPWLKVDNRDSIPKVVALFISGLVPEYVGLPSNSASLSNGSVNVNPNMPVEIPLERGSGGGSTVLGTNAAKGGGKDGAMGFTFDPAVLFRGGGGATASAKGFDPHSMFKGAFPPNPFAAESSSSTSSTTSPTPASAASPTASPDIPLSLPNLPFISRTFSHACPTRAPGKATRMHSVLSAFFSVPMSVEERKRKAAREEKEARERALANAKVQTDILDPTRFELSVTQMRMNEYPISKRMDKETGVELEEMGDGWVEVPLREGESAKGRAKVYAVDCEMCLTDAGKELTRVCVVDYDTEEVVLDRLVKPDNAILDYLTRWSGITASALLNVTTTLSSVQQELLTLLAPPPQTPTSSPPPTPILIGHSLENDLRALKLVHPRCVDTALLFHHPRGRPLKPGLAWLVKKWCDGREVQNRGEGGHDPEEDARACVELVKRKCKGGAGFGEFRTDMEGLFERMGRGTRRAGVGVGVGGAANGRWILESGGEDGVVSELRTVCVDRGKNPSGWHGAGAGKCIGCASDEEVVKGVVGAVEESDFVWGRLMGVAEASGWIQIKQDKEASADDALPSANPSTTSLIDPPPTPDPSKLHTALKQLNAHLTLIHASLPPRTALILFTGHSDPRTMSRLQARKTEFENALRNGDGGGISGGVGLGVSGGANSVLGSKPRWTAADARALEDAVEVAKRGLLFLCIKADAP